METEVGLSYTTSRLAPSRIRVRLSRLAHRLSDMNLTHCLTYVYSPLKLAAVAGESQAGRGFMFRVEFTLQLKGGLAT